MANYGYRCENGHECSHQHLFCPTCGTPVSAVTLRRAGSDPVEEPAADGARRVLCPVGHINTPFDVYCGECGTEIHKIVKEPIKQTRPRSEATVAKCLAGHSVGASDVACPVCGLGIIRSSATAPIAQVRPIKSQAPPSQTAKKTTTAKPQPTPISSLGRTSRIQRVRNVVKDYWVVAVVAAVVVLFIICAFFLSSIKTTSSDSSSGIIAPTTTSASSLNVAVEVQFNLNYALVYTTHSGVCGDSSPTQINVLDGSGIVVAVGSLPVIPGTSNCGYKGVVNVPPRDFYTFTQRTLGELITVPAATMSTGAVRILQSSNGNWRLG